MLAHAPPVARMESATSEMGRGIMGLASSVKGFWPRLVAWSMERLRIPVGPRHTRRDTPRPCLEATPGGISLHLVRSPAPAWTGPRGFWGMERERRLTPLRQAQGLPTPLRSGEGRKANGEGKGERHARQDCLAYGTANGASPPTPLRSGEGRKANADGKGKRQGRGRLG